MIFKTLSLILAFLFLLTSAAGCAAGTGSSSVTTASAASNDTGENSTAETVDEETLLYGSLPDEDYKQYIFNVLNLTSNFAITAFTSDGLTGDVVNDAIYERNLVVEDRLNISIVSDLKSYKEVYSTVSTQVKSGETKYDIAYNESWEMVSLATEGCFYETGALSLDTDKPWWNGNANNSLRVKNYLYMMVGDLHPMFWESMWCIAFNKNMVTDLNLDNVYSLVNDGKWTLEKLSQMINSAASDLNGDGIFGSSDRYGATSYASGVSSPLIHGCGINLLELNEDGTAKSPDDSNLYSVCETISSAIYTNKSVYLKGLSTSVVSDFPVLFEEGNALFELEVIGGIKKLRSSNIEYGIVPFPKHDENQENYISLIAQYAASLGVPVTNSDLGRTSSIIECIAAYSYKYLRPAYYDILLSLKSVRDQESTEMLNMIFENGSFELDLILFNNSGYCGAIKNVMYSGNNSFSSTLKSQAKIIEKKMKVIVDAFVINASK